jgi:anti-sigma-K factor RskA
MSDTPRNEPEHHELAGLSGLHALDALDDESRERFEELLATNPEARAEVDEFRATAAVLAAAVAEEPPAGLRDRVLADVAVTRQDPPVVDLAVRRSRRVRAVWIAAAAAVVLVVGLFAGMVIDRPPRGDAELADVLARSDVRMVPLSGDGPSGVKVVWSDEAGRAVVVANDMADLPDDRTMELWRMSGDRPSRVGVFEPDADGRVRAAFDTDLAGADALGVTIEPAGGSDAPTSPIVLQAELT